MELGSADECFEINDRASETSSNSGQEHDRVGEKEERLRLLFYPNGFDGLL